MKWNERLFDPLLQVLIIPFQTYFGARFKRNERLFDPLLQVLIIPFQTYFGARFKRNERRFDPLLQVLIIPFQTYFGARLKRNERLRPASTGLDHSVPNSLQTKFIYYHLSFLEPGTIYFITFHCSVCCTLSCLEL